MYTHKLHPMNTRNTEQEQPQEHPPPTPSTVPWDEWRRQTFSVCSCCAHCLSSWRCSCGPGVGPRCVVWTWCPSRSRRPVPCPRDLAVCHAVSPLHPSPAHQVRLVILWSLMSWQQLRVTSGWTAVIQNSSVPTKRQFETQVTKSQLKWDQSAGHYTSTCPSTGSPQDKSFVFQNSSKPVQNITHWITSKKSGSQLWSLYKYMSIKRFTSGQTTHSKSFKSLNHS